MPICAVCVQERWIYVRYLISQTHKYLVNIGLKAETDALKCLLEAQQTWTHPKTQLLIIQQVISS